MNYALDYSKFNSNINAKLPIYRFVLLVYSNIYLNKGKQPLESQISSYL